MYLNGFWVRKPVSFGGLFFLGGGGSWHISVINQCQNCRTILFSKMYFFFLLLSNLDSFPS